MKTAREVMTVDVITVAPETTVEEVVDTLLDNNISGVPVVDDDRNMVGIISEYQLLELVFTPGLKSSPVSKFMTRELVTVSEEAELTEVATQFVLHRVRRLPVAANGKLVGVISRRDLLRQLAGQRDGQEDFVSQLGSLAAR